MSPTQLKENPGGSTFNIGLSNSFIHQKRSSSASTYIDSYVRKLVPTDSASALQKNISSPCLSRKNLSQVICAKELVQIKRSPAKKEQPSQFYIGIGIHLRGSFKSIQMNTKSELTSWSGTGSSAIHCDT